MPDEPVAIVPEDVVREAADRFGLPLKRILGSAYRNRRCVVARRWVIRKLRDAGHSLCDIGDALLLDHTTILYHLRVMERMARQATPPLGASQ